MKVPEIENLSFRAKASDDGVAYLKVATTGHGSILFSPNTQPGGETTGQWVGYDVLSGTARWNDDAGESADFVWEQILEKAGNDQRQGRAADRRLRQLPSTATARRCPGAVRRPQDLNDEVIDFS